MSDKIKNITGKKIYVKNDSLLVEDLKNSNYSDIELVNVNINDTNILNNLCELKILQYSLDMNYKNNKITLIKKHNFFAIILDQINLDSGEILENLPYKLNIFCINMCKIKHEIAKTLENKLTNLPSSLEKIYLLYDIAESSDNSIKVINKNKGFNLLFNTKIPLNCDFIIKFGKCNYKINQIDKNTITLKHNTSVYDILYENKIPLPPPHRQYSSFDYFSNYQWTNYTRNDDVTEYIHKFINNLCGVNDDTICKKINKKLLYSSNKYQNQKKYYVF